VTNAQMLTPVLEVPGFAGLALLQNAVTPTSTTLQWNNTGDEVLIVLATTTGITCQILIGETIDGQPVEPEAPVVVAANDPTMFGPFGNEYNIPAQGIVQAVLNNLSNVQVILIQHVNPNS
jgi:3D (Asp-Asp-Asp) domain-containing protein